MPVLNKDINRTYELGNINELPIASWANIFQGAVVGVSPTGYARPLQITDVFAGFADNSVNNAAAPDGAKNIRVIKKGAILLDIPGVTLAHIGKQVYAINDNTFVLSPAGAVYIGFISKVESLGTALVEFDLYATPITTTTTTPPAA